MTHPFQDTRWTLVSNSRGDDASAKAALSELCEAYYEPVVAFLRREGRSDDAARDLAHGFFGRVLRGGGLDNANAVHGRFRSYLLGALKHYLCDHHDQSFAAKRGGKVVHASIDSDPSTSAPGLKIADLQTPAPDAAFDRQWAISLLDSALRELESEMSLEQKPETFAALKPWLTGDAGAASQADVAQKLGLSTEAVKVAIHRLRRRFRALLKKRIADTLEDSAQVEEEWLHLMAALRG